jgi:hypothetical protein
MKTLEDLLKLGNMDSSACKNISEFKYKFSKKFIVTEKDLRDVFDEILCQNSSERIRNGFNEDVVECYISNWKSKYGQDVSWSHIIIRDLVARSIIKKFTGKSESSSLSSFSYKEEHESIKFIIEELPFLRKDYKDFKVMYDVCTEGYRYFGKDRTITMETEYGEFTSWLEKLKGFFSKKEKQELTGFLKNDARRFDDVIDYLSLMFKKIKIKDDKLPGVSISRSFAEVLNEHGDLSRLIYENDKETIEADRVLGVNLESFLNLTDYKEIYSAIEKIISDKNIRSVPGYNHFLNLVRKNLGRKVMGLTLEDACIYSDYISELLLSASDKDSKIRLAIGQTLEHIDEALNDGETTFRFAKRDSSYLLLGNKCGDCTATGSINHPWVGGWISDINTQVLKMAHRGKFLGKNNLVLVKSDNKPVLLVDAIEFIPQVCNIESYLERGEEVFIAGLGKIREIASKMNVDSVYALSQSNSSGMNEFFIKYGYPVEKVSISLIRKKSLEKVLGIIEPIIYRLQSKEISCEISSKEVGNLERFMNDVYFATEENKQEFGKYVNERKIEKISDKIYSELEEHQENLGFKIFSGNSKDLEESFEFLYGLSNKSGAGMELYKVM